MNLKWAPYRNLKVGQGKENFKIRPPIDLKSATPTGKGSIVAAAAMVLLHLQSLIFAFNNNGKEALYFDAKEHKIGLMQVRQNLIKFSHLKGFSRNVSTLGDISKINATKFA